MKNVFISVGMKGRTEEEIEKEITEMAESIKRIFGDVNVIDNFDCEIPEGNNDRLYQLGEAIKKLGNCQFVVTGKNYENYHGCCVEVCTAKEYGIPVCDIDTINDILRFK